jgi:hypothetical protein
LDILLGSLVKIIDQTEKGKQFKVGPYQAQSCALWRKIGQITKPDGTSLPESTGNRLAAITLSHVQCYVPRNTTGASIAFTPWADGSTMSGLMSYSAKCPSRCMARYDARATVSASASSPPLAVRESLGATGLL